MTADLKQRVSGSIVVRSLIFFGSLLALAVLADGMWQANFRPWSSQTDGEPTLTGSWLGGLELSAGRQATLLLQLEQAPDDEGKNLVGTARYCMGAETGRFDVWGDADRSGQVKDLRLRPIEDDPLWLLHDLSIRWEGDRLVLIGRHSFDPSRRHIARSDRPEPRLQIELHKVDEVAFATHCMEP
jgi:hypothetical protein